MHAIVYRLLLAAAFLYGGQSIGQSVTSKITVPLGGNSWVTIKAPNGQEEVTDNGWVNWQNPVVVWSSYVSLPKAGILTLSAVLGVPSGESKINWTINGISKAITVKGPAAKEYMIGQWTITQPGYIKINAQGITKTGNLFANVRELRLSGTSTAGQTAFVKNNDDSYFYWGRRGPSVHINYDISAIDDDIEWFYNEITVPPGNDVQGSYFMADGFGEGYFGMQVNSPTERRVLFSVWSPFQTDDPKSIPEDQKIKLLSKGANVTTGEFGNEGSGGQSYLKYNWKSGQTYRFLLRGKPAANNYTNYSAWFYAADENKWLFIASFSRPATATYLTNLHSFLENFIPGTGNITRKAWYHNQWVVTKAGEWKPLSNMHFTGDATANKKFRVDYAGGAEGGKFFLRNCGFFNDNTPLESNFAVQPPVKKPAIELKNFK